MTPANSPPQPFPQAEIDAFHQDDKRAAAAVVGLMSAIFVMGLLGYLLVCYWVA